MSTVVAEKKPGIPLVAGFRLRLADDWRRMHTRGTVIASGVMATVSAVGPELREAWRGMPDDLKSVIPPHLQQAIAYAILFCGFIAIRYTTIRREPPGGIDAPQ